MIGKGRLALENVARQDSDSPIVQRAAAGDATAFEELLQRYERRMYNVALRYTGDTHEAYDLTQDIFLKVYRSLRGFRGDARFSTWLYRVAMNVCKDHARKQRNASVPDEDVANAPAAADNPGHNPEQHAEQTERGLLIRREIAQLAPGLRDALVLRDLEGFSYTEISDLLEVPEGTVKSWIHRARRQLRQRFEDLQLFPSTRVIPGKGGEAP